MPTCKNCNQPFTIYPEDIKFYAKIGVPAPTFCPDCRQQRRLAWRCERSLYYRRCDLCGREHMSSYKAMAPFPVYCLDCWYGDGWDQLKAGRDFDFNRSFFEQFAEVQKFSPRVSLYITRGTILNSDYCNAVTNIKNCYLVFASNEVEDSLYSNFLKNNSFQICDGTEIYQSERCYDCVNCDQCYNLIGSDDCKVCRDSAFLKDCSGCADCLGCVNLRNQKFCLWNRQLSEKEYRSKVKKINLLSRLVYERSWKVFNQLRLEQGKYQFYHGFNNLNSSGDYLIRCKNSKLCFDCLELEDCRYVTRMNDAKDCFDVDHFGNLGTELVYQTVSCGVHCRNLKFCNQTWDNVNNLEYCDLCQKGCRDCFGCVALTKKQYCILNKQYSEEEYFKLKEKIIGHLKQTGEYGQFFPPALSHVPYTDSLAQDYYPLTKEEAIAKGFRWDDEEKKNYQPATIQPPDNLDEVKDEITKEVLVCGECGRNYKIISQELKFYREMGLPLPKNCFNCRLLARLARKNPRRLYSRQCIKCGTEIQTTYSSDRSEKVYCEDCYRQEIY